MTSCNSSAPAPLDPESLTQFNTITGIGLNYSMVESTAGNNFTISLPAGAVVVQAYFWLVEDEDTATPVTTATFNGTGVTATNATTNFLWSPLWYTTLRFDVTSLVTATGTSYSWASGSVSSIGIAQSGFLVIVYQLASDTTETTLVFADGMNVWHANETTEDGPGPEPVGLDWSCADNPVCNVNDVTFSRAGGNIYNVDDGDVSDGKYADEILNPANQAVLWTGPSGQLPICGSEPCPQIAPYTPGSPAFSVGQDSTEYDLYNNTTYAAKDTVFLASLVLMNKCPNPQSPTPTPNWTATPSPTTVPTSCGPPPSLYSTGTEYAGGSSASPFNAVTVVGPATLPTDPLLLVRIYMGDPSYVTAAGILTGVSLGGVPLARWAAGINQIPTQQGTTADTDFETWYLAGATIPTGSNTLSLTWSGGASEYPITVDAEFFQNANQTTPLGAASMTAEQTEGGTYTSSLTTTKGNSLVSTLLEDGSSGGAEYAGCEATNNATTEFALASGAPDVSGAEKDGPVGAGGATSITWTLPTCNTYYWVAENVEILGVPCNNSPTPSPTKTFTPSPTKTFTASPTNTFTPSPTNSFTASPTKTNTPSPTNTFTVSPTNTFTVSPTNTFTLSPTKTFTASPTNSFTPSPTSSFTASPTKTNTPSPTNTFTVSPTSTFTVSPTNTFTASPTRTITVSPTNTYSFSPTNTFTASPTRTFTPSPTNTFSVSPTSTFTASPTDTFTASPTSTKLPTGSVTNTYTFTVSPTLTFTASPTRTFTASPTNSFSFSPTSTFTDSPTASFTPSPTDSFTDSPTLTSTASPTRTFTATPSFTLQSTGSVTDTYTVTVSPTDTPSVTPTRTFSDSPTESATATPTSSFTDSPTLTSTQSPTRTFTATPTFTLQSTGSATDTLTSTVSPTDSSTDSPTESSTESATEIPSPTSTETSTLGASPTSSFTDSPTRTSTLTQSPVASATDSPTDSPTDTVSVTLTDSPQNTATDTRTASPSVTDSPSSSVTKTSTPTATDTPSATDSPSRTPSLTETQSATVTQTFTESATPVPEPYTVTVNIFNSAGELVRSLYSGTSENSAEQAQVLATVGANGGTQVNITGLDGNAGANLVWNSTNNASQAVAAGVYTVQIQTKNNFGQIQTQTQMVSVMNAAGPATLNIYNSAGELVANLSNYMVGQASAPIGMSLVLPNGQSGVIAAAAGSTSGGLLIKVTFANGNTLNVPWTGLSAQGQPLQPGNYLATLSQAEAGSGTVVKSVPFVLLDTSNASASGMAQSALVVPNPVDQNWFTVQYTPAGTDTAVAMLYDLSGQLVAEGVSNGGNSLRLSGSWSGGIYLLDFEVHGVPAGLLARRVLKVAIVR